MRKATTKVRPAVGTLAEGSLRVVTLPGHAYTGREGHVLPGTLPGGFVRVGFADRYIGIFQPGDLASVAAAEEGGNR